MIAITDVIENSAQQGGKATHFRLPGALIFDNQDRGGREPLAARRK
jgi:hypothetical protein